MVAAVVTAAAVGAVCRYLTDAVVSARTTVLPLGTLVVNVVGALALGVIVGRDLVDGGGDAVGAVVGAGFLGGYTTFSTFAYETVGLFEAGAPRRAMLNVAANVGLGLAAAVAGLVLAAAIR